MSNLSIKNKRIASFIETTKMIDNDEYLKEEVKKSIAVVYGENNDFSQNFEKTYETQIELSNFDTITETLRHRNEKLCVLVFSSDRININYKKRGIGNNQESDILRQTTLSKSIDNTYCFRNFYKNNQLESRYLGTDNVLYVKDVIIFKQKDNLLLKKHWMKSDFVIATAPDLSNHYMENAKLYDIQYKRLRNVFESAIKNKRKVLILGAIGCGENYNSPTIIARVFDNLLEIYSGYFKKIVFAIKCNDVGKVNYKAFKKILFDNKIDKIDTNYE